MERFLDRRKNPCLLLLLPLLRRLPGGGAPRGTSPRSPQRRRPRRGPGSPRLLAAFPQDAAPRVTPGGRCRRLRRRA